MKYFVKFFDSISRKECYAGLFKASVAIATLYLVSIVQVLGLVIPIEADAQKYRHEVEYELKMEVEFKDLECSFEMQSYEACRLALYNNNLSTGAMEAYKLFVDLLGCLVIVFFSISAIGFFIHNSRIKKT